MGANVLKNTIVLFSPVERNEGTNPILLYFKFRRVGNIISTKTKTTNKQTNKQNTATTTKTQNKTKKNIKGRHF